MRIDWLKWFALAILAVDPGRRDRRAARRARIPTAPRRRGGGRAPERAARDRSRRARGAANTRRDLRGRAARRGLHARAGAVLSDGPLAPLDRGRARGVDWVARAAARSRAAAVRLSPAGARASRAAAGARARLARGVYRRRERRAQGPSLAAARILAARLAARPLGDRGHPARRARLLPRGCRTTTSTSGRKACCMRRCPKRSTSS